MSALLRLWDYIGILVLGVAIGSFIQFIHDKKQSEHNVKQNPDPMFVPAEIANINTETVQILKRDDDFKRIFNYIQKASKEGSHWVELRRDSFYGSYYGNIDPDLFYDTMTDLGYTIHNATFLNDTNKGSILHCMNNAYKIRISWKNPKPIEKVVLK